MNEKTGRVLRIEKTSIHDGNGLRTVVFLKGCPLRCKWCSTPESQSMASEFGYGMDMTADEIVREVCKDEIFFFHSGGGVTVSGGEVLLQADFTKDILQGCREQGIQTAIETSLFAEYEEIEKLIPFLNAMYIDFKVYDEEKHQHYTGVSNKKIKDNLIRLDQTFDGEIHIRIPVVPGVNLSQENMEKTAQFLSGLKSVVDVELLPYHRLGLETYRKMGRIYEMEDTIPPSMEEMKAAAGILCKCASGCPVKIKGELFE